ncbi:hypothetical protein ACHAXS_005362, partial [Conticribra weissflogii]
SADNSYHGGTIYVDAASGLIHVVNQVSLGAGETLAGKGEFEQWIWDLAAVTVNAYHSDNGIFVAEEYRDDCAAKSQSQLLSGVGAQHQNAIAERAIQTISYWPLPNVQSGLTPLEIFTKTKSDHRDLL